jgi:tetratricopeptide (TPR) repeat protein
LATGVAACALLCAAPALARVEPSSPLSTYVQARAASSAGADAQASAGYAAALAAAPDNEVVAAQALNHAVSAGDWPLALRAAQALERRSALLPDGRLLLLAEAFRTRNWREAGRQIDAIERDELFAFAVPVLRAWRAVGAREGDPLALLPRSDASNAAAAYGADQRPLLMIAMGRPEGTALLQTGVPEGPRAVRRRIGAAAALAKRGNWEQANALLQGEGPQLAAARRLVEARRPLPGAIDDAASGYAAFLIKLALDLQSQELTPLAATFARIATWVAPNDGDAWIVAAELAGREERHESAVAMLANVGADDPWAEAARDQRIRSLIEGGLREHALGEAQAAASAGGAGSSEQVRLGEVLMSLERPRDAAQAFARAIELRDANNSNYPEWALWLLRGGAHDEAGDWPQARDSLQRAYRLAAGEPLVLNYLGYAQLVHNENLAEAERLIREAHRLAPTNSAITDSLGWALFLKGERAEAIALLEQAAQGAPADVEINEHLGDAYFAVGRRAEARFAWAAARVYAEGEAATRLAQKIETGPAPALAAR